MEVLPDNGAAVEFLQRWRPGGPWVLTSVLPDKKSIQTRTFEEGSLQELQEWLQRFNNRRNIYFHVNPTTHAMQKKAEREDIASMDWLHVDIDPRAGEDIAQERRRALELLTSRLPTGVPAPTVVIFSGGGYQGFWKLEEPLPINGNLELAEDAKRYNQQLEVLFGADNCHNIDRIMRLPGTVNLPDARKLRKGRKPELATLVSFDERAVYPLNRFTPAPAVQMQGDTGFNNGSKSVKVSGNIERIADVAELDNWSVPDRTKVIIVQGRHPDETKERDNSRSAWLFDAICAMVRCEVPDDVIFSIITDPDFGISESVLDKGSNAQKYAIRQIERGKEEAVDPWLRRLNERHAVIGNMGGKCRVVEEVLDHSLNRTRLTRQSFDDLRNRYMNVQVQVGMTKDGNPVMKTLGQFWLTHPLRRQYDTIVFAPGREVSQAYNLWRGFSCTARPGDCNLFLEHMRLNICQGDEVLYQYLLHWMARAVQQPDSPGEVAVVLRGGRGVGKSLWAREFGKLFGRHFMHVSNPSHLVGNFNAHLRDVVLLFADEAFYAGDKRHASVLKTIVTEETITIEAKGIDAEASPNYVHLIMASNEQHVVPAGGDERRFLVLEVGKEHQQDTVYFSALLHQMENGGREALLSHLLTLPLDKFQVRNVPQTDALQEQKLLSLSVEEEWWFQKLLEGRLLRSGSTWETEVRKDELVDDYIEHTRRFNITRRGNATALGRFLRRMCPTLDVVQRMASYQEPTSDGWSRQVEKRTYFWQLPSLAAARGRWEELFGSEQWHDADVQDDIPF